MMGIGTMEMDVMNFEELKRELDERLLTLEGVIVNKDEVMEF